MKKTVLFLIMSDTDTTFNFILAMLQSQLINLLCDRADDKYGGRLPVHVRLILDEFSAVWLKHLKLKIHSLRQNSQVLGEEYHLVSAPDRFSNLQD